MRPSSLTIEKLRLIKQIFRAFKYKLLAKNFLNNHSDFIPSSIKFISFNGRTVSFSFIDKSTNKKLFFKRFLFRDSPHFNVSIKELVERKFKLVGILSEANLLSYSSYKLNGAEDTYLRDYVDGVPLSEYFKFINDFDFDKKTRQVIKYLKKVMKVMRNHNFFVSVDLHLHNIIILNNGEVNLIDLDHVYVDIDKDNFEAELFARFFFKSTSYLTIVQQKILFDILKQELQYSHDFEKLLLNKFFSSIHTQNKFFNNFVLNNSYYFSKHEISFDKNIKIKDKIIETLKNLPKNSYVVAKRYDWLFSSNDFKGKGIDIVCDINHLKDIEKIFSKNGWEVYSGKIFQFFECQNIIVSIDLCFNSKDKYEIEFNEILQQSDKNNEINIVDENIHHRIIYFSFCHKKIIKQDHLKNLKSFANNSSFDFSINDNLKIPKFIFNYKGYAYYSPWYFFKRIFENILNHKDIVVIGADGAGKSTVVEIIHNNISMYVDSRKKYMSGFFYPSGRTNLFMFKTSKLFLFLKYLKDKFFLKSSLIQKPIRRSYLSSNHSSMKTWRNVQSLNVFHTQFFLIILLPLLIIDAWTHQLLKRFSSVQIYVCDRYYDEIILNYSKVYFRKIIRLLLPSSKYKYYVYAMPEEHFLRKGNGDENIEMILHMQKCYKENNNYLAEIPTNIDRAFVNKKILTIALNII
jgi:hypothetical protein